MCEVLRGLNFQQLRNGKVIEAMIKAVKQWRVEFVTEILKAYPNFMWCVEKSMNRHIFMVVVLCRSPALNLSFTMADHDKNNILHFAAMLEPSARLNTIPGVAFLTQREVQWYKCWEFNRNFNL
ncbi:hypothetical protein CFP56_041144 [Quercus suber]|uniref:Ankyrin repeat family protein n=1 Tax=Quercus suber TaxID=58331 RepID=A0AAW0IW06_QUESU